MKIPADLQAETAEQVEVLRKWIAENRSKYLLSNGEHGGQLKFDSILNDLFNQNSGIEFYQESLKSGDSAHIEQAKRNLDLKLYAYLAFSLKNQIHPPIGTPLRYQQLNPLQQQKFQQADQYYQRGRQILATSKSLNNTQIDQATANFRRSANLFQEIRDLVG